MNDARIYKVVVLLRSISGQKILVNVPRPTVTIRIGEAGPSLLVTSRPGPEGSTQMLPLRLISSCCRREVGSINAQGVLFEKVLDVVLMVLLVHRSREAGWGEVALPSAVTVRPILDKVLMIGIVSP